MHNNLQSYINCSLLFVTIVLSQDFRINKQKMSKKGRFLCSYWKKISLFKIVDNLS